MDRNVGMNGWMERVKRGELDAVLIAGPTASGKSAIAMTIAEMCNGVVVNADSMQVYRDLRVLSARPNAQEEARVEHRMFGMIDGAREYSVGDYLRDAAPVLADLKRTGRLAVIAGGTGLYFRALTAGLVELPDIPEAVRRKWEGLAEQGENLHAHLAERDPEAAAALNPADTPRLVRALEVIEATGQSILVWRRSAHSRPLLEAGRWTGFFINTPRAVLSQRIDARFLAMMAEGALDEVRALAARGLPANRGVMKAHGAPHLIAHLNGRLSLPEAVVLGQRDTRRYAKRQLTWARNFMADWTWCADGADILA